MDTRRDVRGIILAGTYHWGESSFETLIPRPLVPVALRPLISYALGWLRDGGVPEATVCVNSASRPVRSYLGNGSHLAMSLDYLEDWTPRGAAGCARDAGLKAHADTFVVADGTAVPAVDLEKLLEAHREADAAVTVVVHRHEAANGADEPTNPGGIYVFSRRALGYVPATSFQDIKENLIPRLYKEGEKVVTFEGFGVCPRVLNADTYLAVNQWMIERMADQAGFLEGYRVVGDSLVHPSVQLDPSARLVGPVLIGPSVQVRAGATVVGPTTIGVGSIIDEGALVSRSVTWRRCVVGESAVVDRCLLADDAAVEPRNTLYSALRVPGRSLGQVFSGRRVHRPELPLPEPLPQRVGS